MNSEAPLKNYYEILGLDPSCSGEEIRHAFRQQVAKSHPDKVSHLSKQIQELATSRTTELTEAYRVLADETKRPAYDRRLKEAARSRALVEQFGNPTQRAPETHDSGSNSNPEVTHVQDSAPQVNGFLLKTAIDRLKIAVRQSMPGAKEVQIEGFDAAFVIRRKWDFLKAEKGGTTVFARVVTRFDSSALQDGWYMALKAARATEGETYLFLLGTALGSAAELSSAIRELQRRTRKEGTKILVVPLNVNTFDALIPNGAPAPLRAIIKALPNS
jgi:curved DNA-binding protein CbpA